MSFHIETGGYNNRQKKPRFERRAPAKRCGSRRAMSEVHADEVDVGELLARDLANFGGPPEVSLFGVGESSSAG